MIVYQLDGKQKEFSKCLKNKPVWKIKNKAIEAARLQIEKQFGKGSLMKMGEQTKLEVESIPTGSILLDEALGVGGLPQRQNY